MNNLKVKMMILGLLKIFLKKRIVKKKNLLNLDFLKDFYLKKDFKKLYDKDGASNKFIISLFKGGEKLNARNFKL